MPTINFNLPDYGIGQKKRKPFIPAQPTGASKGLFDKIGSFFSSSAQRGREQIQQAQQSQTKPFEFPTTQTKYGVVPASFGRFGYEQAPKENTPILGPSKPSFLPPEAEALEKQRQEIIARRGSVSPVAPSAGQVSPPVISSPSSTGVIGSQPRTPTGLTLPEAEETQRGGTTTSITDYTESKTRSARDKLIDLLLERASKPFDIEGTFKSLREEAGIPGLEETKGKFVKQIADVEGLLDQLEGDITKRVGGSLVTEEQRRRLLASEREPLAKELGIAERGLGTVESALEPKEQYIRDLLGFRQMSRQEELASLASVAQLGGEEEERLSQKGFKERELGLKEREVGIKEREATGKKAELEFDKLRSEINKNNASAAASIAKASQVGNGRPLPVARADFFASSQNTLTMLDQMESLLNKISTGPVAGISAMLRRGTGTESSARISFNTIAKNLSDQILRVRSGAQTGEKELDRLLNFLPDVTHQEEVNRENIKRLRETIKAVTKMNATILSQTGYNVPFEATEKITNDYLSEDDFQEE